MSSPCSGGRIRSLQLPKRFPFLARTILIAAVAAFATAGNAIGAVSTAPAGTISGMRWTVAAVEGQSFSGIVAAFTDSDVVTTANFTNISINWGDGSLLGGGVPEQSGVDSQL